MSSDLNRRKFLGGAAAASGAFTFVPRHVLGGQAGVPPSDKINVAYIGCGTEGLLELMTMLTIPEIQVVATCDPVKNSNDYRDFGGSDRVKGGIQRFLGKPDWRANESGIPGGRDVAKEVIESYYAQFRPNQQFRGVNTYADFRELLEKERDIDAVKIMTPDHTHAAIAIAAMNRGKHVTVHKPLANRMHEARRIFEVARQTKVATHFAPWRGTIDPVAAWIKDGAIGTLREIHNWTNRPMWPQYLKVPSERPAVPSDFDWNLWLGPSVDRPYHPYYTHMVFRGWYEFGGGSMADMGHYSLWPVFASLNLPAAVSAAPVSVGAYELANHSANRIQNDYSFPLACRVKFRLPAANGMGPIDLYWYDGGMRPTDPPELAEDNRELGGSGMLFIGDKGKILDGRIIPESRMKAYAGAEAAPAGGRGGRGGGEQQARGGQAAGQGRGGSTAGQASGQGGPSDLNVWVAAMKGGPQSPANFLNAVAITETFNLGMIALRANQRVEYDPATRRITTNEKLNQYLTREYRKGWEI